MTADPITKDFLQSIHLYSYEDVQEFSEISRTLEQEMQKPAEKRDMNLIEECLCYIELIMDDGKSIDDATLEAKYQEALARGKAKKAKVLNTAPKANKHKVRKAFIIIAAAITVLLTTLTIAAKVHGYKNAWEFVWQKALELRWFESGEIIEEDGITLTGNGELKTFATFEEFLESEGLDIMYPQSLPKDLKLESIFKYNFENGKLYYTLQFAPKETSIMISSSFSIDVTQLNYIETILVDQNLFYIICNDDQSYQAICQANGWEYTVNAPNYETLLALLQNMKGSQS